MADDVRTTVDLAADIAEVLRREQAVFGSSKRVISAAIWLFGHAPEALRRRAIVEINGILEETPIAAEGSVERYFDDLVQQASLPPPGGLQPKAGRSTRSRGRGAG